MVRKVAEKKWRHGMNIKNMQKNDDLEAKKDIEEAEMYAESEDNALTASDDLVRAVGLHFINKNRKAYEKLAKG